MFVDGLTRLFVSDNKGEEQDWGSRDKSMIALRDATLQTVERVMLDAIRAKVDHMGSERIVLVLDGLDFLLAAMGVDPEAMMDMVAEVQEVSWQVLAPCGVLEDNVLINGCALACKSYHYHGFCRLPSQSGFEHPFRSQSRRLCYRSSASGQVDHESTIIRYWDCERH